MPSRVIDFNAQGPDPVGHAFQTLPLPQGISPQLTQLVETAPSGPNGCEIKLDGFQMAARIELGQANF